MCASLSAAQGGSCRVLNARAEGGWEGRARGVSVGVMLLQGKASLDLPYLACYASPRGMALKLVFLLVLRLSTVKCKWGSLCSNDRSAWPRLGTLWAHWEEWGSCLRVIWAPSKLSDEELGAGQTLRWLGSAAACLPDGALLAVSKPHFALQPPPTSQDSGDTGSRRQVP